MIKDRRYSVLDKDAKYGIKGQYESILDRNPNLINWEEEQNYNNEKLILPSPSALLRRTRKKILPAVSIVSKI
ncbi:hypothetical protein EDC21_102130 [Thermohydrogenium kirishiense]|nr:hypothetical protein EDC21_102130 [Thermohydrogenium kirishiense]